MTKPFQADQRMSFVNVNIPTCQISPRNEVDIYAIFKLPLIRPDPSSQVRPANGDHDRNPVEVTLGPQRSDSSKMVNRSLWLDPQRYRLNGASEADRRPLVGIRSAYDFKEQLSIYNILWFENPHIFSIEGNNNYKDDLFEGLGAVKESSKIILKIINILLYIGFSILNRINTNSFRLKPEIPKLSYI